MSINNEKNVLTLMDKLLGAFNLDCYENLEFLTLIALKKLDINAVTALLGMGSHSKGMP